MLHRVKYRAIAVLELAPDPSNLDAIAALRAKLPPSVSHELVVLAIDRLVPMPPPIAVEREPAAPPAELASVRRSGADRSITLLIVAAVAFIVFFTLKGFHDLGLL